VAQVGPLVAQPADERLVSRGGAQPRVDDAVEARLGVAQADFAARPEILAVDERQTAGPGAEVVGGLGLGGVGAAAHRLPPLVAAIELGVEGTVGLAQIGGVAEQQRVVGGERGAHLLLGFLHFVDHRLGFLRQLLRLVHPGRLAGDHLAEIGRDERGGDPREREQQEAAASGDDARHGLDPFGERMTCS